MIGEHVEHRGLHGIVVQQVGLMITTGRLGADQQIVPEQLCEQLGVSRSVIREALRVLQAKGMVEPRPKTGTRVRSVENWDLLDRDVILWRVQGPDRDAQFRELLELRSVVEPVAVVGCCEFATDDDIAALFHHCDEMDKAIEAGNTKAFTDADIRFHNQLLIGSGNLLFRRFAGAIEAVLRAREELGLMPEHVDDAAGKSHRGLATAIRANRPTKAESLARQIVSLAGSEVVEGLHSSLSTRAK